MMRAILVACLFATIAFLPPLGGAHGIEGAHSEGYIADVIVIDMECEENQTCISRPSNVVEYFGADWCDECPEVEAQLREISDSSVIILSHRPSSSDDFWLQASKERFLDVYGLWGYPTLAIDGHYILAGPTQSQELNSLLSESISNYSGISNVSLEGENLSIVGDLDNLSIDVWTVNTNSNLTNVVTNHTNFSQTNVVDTNGEKLVIVVSKPGYIALVSGSSMPANDYNPDGGIDEIRTEGDSVSGSTIIIITVLLLMISLPATYQLFQIMRQPTETTYKIQNVSIKDSVVLDSAFSNNSEEE